MLSICWSLWRMLEFEWSYIGGENHIEAYLLLGECTNINENQFMVIWIQILKILLHKYGV